MDFAQNGLHDRAASGYGECSWKRFLVRSTMKSIACILLCFPFATLVARAQGVGSSGEITGTVTDSSGAALPKATVNVVDTQTGLKRTATTNGTDQFRVTGLPPATYDVSAQMPGFATRNSKRRHGRHRTDGHLRFQDETFAGGDGRRGNGPAARCGNGTRQPNRQNFPTVHQPTCRLTGAITLRLRCWRRGFPMPPGLPATRIFESSRRPPAACLSTAATVAATA